MNRQTPIPFPAHGIRCEPRSDKDLLEDFVAHGDSAAFDGLLARHGPMVLDVCRSVLSNETDIEDSFQATFLVLAQKAGSIRKPGAVASWLHGVAYRTALKARAEFARRRKHETRAAIPVGCTDNELSWREVQCVLHEELASLAERYRAPMVLCYLQGRTHDEASNLIGVPKGTLKMRLEQGRARLRARLLQRGIGPGAVLLAMAWPGAAATAAVPAALLTTTTKAAVATVSGQSAAGLISAQAALLANTGLPLSWISHGKLAALMLVIVVPAVALSIHRGAQVPPEPAPVQTTEFHHDFRLGMPLPEWLVMDGPVQDATIDFGDQGLRITLPPKRDRHHAVGVATRLLFSGDFEITAAFELLSASRPAAGYGVGVSLNLGRVSDRDLFGKIARFVRAEEGSVFVSEYWNNHPPKTYALESIPTETRTGRLRLVRQRDTLRFLAAAGFERDFQKIDQRIFGSEDLTQLRLVVSDSGEPGNPVDARLLELRIVGSKVAVINPR
jgi:RNA polymerase sigma factor (sigma-70 family)